MDGTALLPVCLRPELFPGIGVLPGPATECVCWLFIFKDTEPSPLQDSSSACVLVVLFFKDTEPSPLRDSFSLR